MVAALISNKDLYEISKQYRFSSSSNLFDFNRLGGNFRSSNPWDHSWNISPYFRNFNPYI